MITLYKTGTYSLMHITVAFMVGYAITGSVQKAMAISLIEPIVQTFFFFFHEKLWSRASNRFAAQSQIG